jgi:5'-methylthioadenosine phosphorylase
MQQIKIGLIGGSGLGQALSQTTEGHRHEVQTPFGPPSDAIIETEWEGVSILFLSRHGPGHRYAPSQVPYRANIFALKQLGCTHILASGAVGSLREHLRPRDLVVCDQIIDKTNRRFGTFYDQAAVHVEFADPYCPVLRKLLLDAGKRLAESEQPAAVHDQGCYVCMEGPAFSTRAESAMHRLWGGDLIGMTGMPEARLAREAELPYALLALVTDYDCWRTRPPLDPDKLDAPHTPTGDQKALLEEIIGNLNAATDNATRLLREALRLVNERREDLATSPARDSLKLAIWSDKQGIDAEEAQKLQPLWGRYFA